MAAVENDYAAYIQTPQGEYPLRDIGAVRTDQGSSNSGKFLGIGPDGNVSPMDPPKGATVEQEAQIEKNKQDISSLSEDLLNKMYIVFPYENHDGYLLNSSGHIYNDFINHSSITDYIKVKKGDSFYYKGIGNSAASSVCYYDSDKAFIKSEQYKSLDDYILITVNVDCEYARFCSYAAIGDDVIFSLCKSDEFTEEFLRYVLSKYNFDDIESNKNKIAEAQEKIAEIQEKIETTENSNFNSILCIGDSLTEGDYGSEPSGTANIHEKNYPYFLKKYLNCEVVNKGKCGYTSKMYWNNTIKTIDFDTINPKIIVIMLGTNGGMTNTLETDVEPFDNYNDYLDTGTGDYCKIIEYVNEKTNGKSQIVLCTCPFVDSARRPGNANNVQNANIVIPKIADRYKLPIIDVNGELGLSALNTQVLQPIDGLHFGEIGYSRLGTFIGSKLKGIHSFVYE